MTSWGRNSGILPDFCDEAHLRWDKGVGWLCSRQDISDASCKTAWSDDQQAGWLTKYNVNFEEAALIDCIPRTCNLASSGLRYKGMDVCLCGALV